MQFAPLDKKARAAWREMLNPTDGTRIGAAAAMFLLPAINSPFRGQCPTNKRERTCQPAPPDHMLITL